MILTIFNFARLRNEVLKEKENIDDGIGVPGKRFSEFKALFFKAAIISFRLEARLMFTCVVGLCTNYIDQRSTKLWKGFVFFSTVSLCGYGNFIGSSLYIRRLDLFLLFKVKNIIY